MKRENIQDYLLADGIKPNLIGFEYLTEALSIYSLMKPITKELYPEIAKKYNTTPFRVERGIRHAIESGNKGVRQKTNSEYIAFAKIMVERMKCY